MTHIDSPIVKFDMHFSEWMPRTNSLYKSLMKNDHELQVIAVYGFEAPNINLHYHQF